MRRENREKMFFIYFNSLFEKLLRRTPEFWIHTCIQNVNFTLRALGPRLLFESEILKIIESTIVNIICSVCVCVCVCVSPSYPFTILLTNMNITWQAKLPVLLKLVDFRPSIPFTLSVLSNFASEIQ